MTEAYYLGLSKSKPYYLTLPGFLELMKCQLLGIQRRLDKDLSKLSKTKNGNPKIPQHAMDCIYSIVSNEARNYINDHHYECVQYHYSRDDSFTDLYNSLDTFKKQFVKLYTHHGFRMHCTIQIQADDVKRNEHQYINLRIKRWNRLLTLHREDSTINRYGSLWRTALKGCGSSHTFTGKPIIVTEPVSLRDVQQLIDLMIKSIHRQIKTVDKQALHLEKCNKLYVPKNKMPLEIPPKILAL